MEDNLAMAFQAEEWADRIAAKMAAGPPLNEGERRHLLEVIAELRFQANMLAWVEGEVDLHL